MPLNRAKFKDMHIGCCNSKVKYFLQGNLLNKTALDKKLRIASPNDLRFSEPYIEVEKRIQRI